MFVDSYDWVMVPNVYAMSQHADGGLITTKPYFSGSSYVKKMVIIQMATGRRSGMVSTGVGSGIIPRNWARISLGHDVFDGSQDGRVQAPVASGHRGRVPVESMKKSLR